MKLSSVPTASAPRYRAITRRNVAETALWARMSAGQRRAVEVVSQVLPFRTNEYVLEALVDADRLPEDPMFQLTVPQPGMLSAGDFDTVDGALRAGESSEALAAKVGAIRRKLNPHPAGQMSLNVPRLEGRALEGMQHKYAQTLLYFPRQGQTCHAYCTFCFRWAQFVGMEGLKFAARESSDLVRYLGAHPEISDLLITGGDPLVMRTPLLERHLAPVLEADLPGLQNIRFGTKSVAYWPHRFVSDPDADDLLRLFERIIAQGRHVAVMAHYNHPVELSTPIAREAVRRIRNTGAQIRMQSPLIRRVNDDPALWSELWRTGVGLGMVPYYMFVERDTGPRGYFELPLIRAWEIFGEAYAGVSGLARTVRGPSMSATPGKVLIDGVATVAGRRVFCLQLLQAREGGAVRRPFFARFDPQATWFDQLEPAFAEDAEFFARLEAHSAGAPRRLALV